MSMELSNVASVESTNVNQAEKNGPESASSFGLWMKEQRVGVGLSIREAAWRSGMSVQRLLSIEAGKLQVGMNSVETSVLCRTYKITADEFLARAGAH